MREQQVMKTLTRDEALTELAAIPGYSELVARNVLFEAAKEPYVIANDGTVFLAATSDGRFKVADVQRSGAGRFADGAEFAAPPAGPRLGAASCHEVPAGVTATWCHPF
jgi:hypothetical protein